MGLMKESVSGFDGFDIRFNYWFDVFDARFDGSVDVCDKRFN